MIRFHHDVGAAALTQSANGAEWCALGGRTALVAIWSPKQNNRRTLGEFR